MPTTTPLPASRVCLPVLLLGVAGLAGLAGCSRRVEIPVPPPTEDPSPEWSQLLGQAADKTGVDYDLIDQQRDVLERYLAWVGAHGELTDMYKESQEDKRIAFLLNAYNAAVISGVLINRPLDSVRDVAWGPLHYKGAGFFVGQKFQVDGEWNSLYVLEQQRIVARYQDPLLHAGLSCASKGCPPVQWWDARGLKGRLRSAMRRYLGSDHGLLPTGPPDEDGVPTTYQASQIFSWYADDFTDWSDADNVCQWMVDYTKGAKKTWLKAHAEDCSLDFLPYDWSLNQAPSRPPITTPSHAEGSGSG